MSNVTDAALPPTPDPIDTLQTIVTLDLEGVLIPEVWVAVAETTGIDGLLRTTRDEPDYDVLMQYRLGLLAEQRPVASTVPGVAMPLVAGSQSVT